MTDLPKAIEADLFGSSEWAVDFLEPLVKVATGHERALIAWRLSVNVARVAAEQGAPAPAVAAPPDDALAASREGLLEASAGGHARLREAAEAFVATYDEVGGTLYDEVLVAVALHNVLKREHARAAETFETAADEMKRRIAAGVNGWQESAKSCVFRAIIAWRLAGDEAKAARAKTEADRLGGPTLPPR